VGVPLAAGYLTKNYTSRPEGLVLLARSHYDKGKFADAATILDQTLQQHPEDADALLWGGIISYRLDRFPEAASRLEKAMESLGNHRMATEYWYRCLSRLGDPRAPTILDQLKRLREAQSRLEELQLKDMNAGPLAIVEQIEAGSLFLELGMNPQGVHWLTRVVRD